MKYWNYFHLKITQKKIILWKYVWVLLFCVFLCSLFFFCFLYLNGMNVNCLMLNFIRSSLCWWKLFKSKFCHSLCFFLFVLFLFFFLSYFVCIVVICLNIVFLLFLYVIIHQFYYLFIYLLFFVAYNAQKKEDILFCANIYLFFYLFFSHLFFLWSDFCVLGFYQFINFCW